MGLYVYKFKIGKLAQFQLSGAHSGNEWKIVKEIW